MFDTPYFATTIGLACAGGTLIYQHVYATLVRTFADLVGTGETVPSVAGLGSFAWAITGTYVRSLGGRRPDGNYAVSVVAAAHFAGLAPEAFELRPILQEPDGLVTYVEHKFDVSENQVHFFGDQTQQAQQLLAEIRSPEPRFNARR